MKHDTIRFVAPALALLAATSAMAHGGHEDAGSAIVHRLYHELAAGRFLVAIAAGLLIALAHRPVLDAVRRLLDRDGRR